MSLDCVVDACLDAHASTMQTRSGASIDMHLCHPGDYRLTHLIAQAVRTRAEALRIPSCTRFPGRHLIVFTDLLRPGSSIEIVGAINLELRP